MKHNLIPFAVAPLAALLLTACGDNEPEVVGAMADPDADAIEQLDPAELPPMETRSASYRCADNSIVYVTFFTNDSQVAVATEQGGARTVLQNEANAAPAGEEAAEGEEAAAPEGPARFSGEGYTVVGTGSSIQFGRPGGSLQTCNS